MQPIQFMLSSTTGALAVVAVAILRIYLGWAYVGNRLLSAAVDYEESGWWVAAGLSFFCSLVLGSCHRPSGPGTGHALQLGYLMAVHASMPCLGQPEQRDQMQQLALTAGQGVEAHLPVFDRYDGQTFVKPPEVLARDRLLGTYEVKPTLDRLKTTLLGAAGGLLTSAVLLLGSFAAEADASMPRMANTQDPRFELCGDGVR